MKTPEKSAQGTVYDALRHPLVVLRPRDGLRARRMAYNIIAGMFSIFSEPNLSNLVISAAKSAIIGTVHPMHW